MHILIRIDVQYIYIERERDIQSLIYIVNVQIFPVSQNSLAMPLFLYIYIYIY